MMFEMLHLQPYLDVHCGKNMSMWQFYLNLFLICKEMSSFSRFNDIGDIGNNLLENKK